MTNTHRLLEQIASLTSIQDLELLEFSLLKTLHGFLKPKSLSLLRLDAKGRPVMEIVYGDNKCHVNREDLNLSEAMRRADDFITSSGASEMTFGGEAGVQLVINLLSTRLGRSYLVLALSSELSKMNAHLVAGVLQIYRNFCALVLDAQTDQLTGLANRKTFDECVTKVHELIQPPTEELANDRRMHKEMRYWLVMVDIDHFKAVNDLFGHLYGDEVLILLARLMKSSFREDDMMFRFGGEEFVLIIRCSEQDSCRHALERFRKTVENHYFPQVGQVTISIGATQMDDETFAGTLLDYADQALYHSKRNGRNQTTFFEDIVATGAARKEEIAPGEISFF